MVQDVSWNMFLYKHVFKRKSFHSSEQDYQFQHAQYIRDHEIAEDLLGCYDGLVAKKISYDLNQARCKEWNSVPSNERASGAKVLTNPNSDLIILNSAQSYLMESMHDGFWGIGLKRKETDHCATDQIPAYNVLGWMLMVLRGPY